MAGGASPARQFAICIYGATGYTGQLCVQQLDMLLSLPGAIPHAWAIAGRNKAKLKLIASQCQRQPSIIVVPNPAELLEMCRSSQVIVATAGPFARLGTDVVAACVEAGTHYIDIDGEQVWINQMINDYHAEAKEKGVQLVFSAGQESAPYDIIAYKLVEQLGPLRQLRIYMFQYGDVSGGTALTGSVNIQGMANTSSDAIKVYHDPFCLGGQRKGGVRQDDKDLRSVEQDPIFPRLWLFPFAHSLCQVRIVRRTCALFEETPSDKVEYGEYFQVLLREAAPKQRAAELSLATSAKPLPEDPEIIREMWKAQKTYQQEAIAAGQIPRPGEGTTVEMRGFYYSNCWAIAEGENGDWAHLNHIGPDTYEITAICTIVGALTLAEEQDVINPGGSRGGCLTPAYAFHKSSWFDRVEEHPMSGTSHLRCTFEVSDDIPDESFLIAAMNQRSMEAMKGQKAIATGEVRMFGPAPYSANQEAMGRLAALEDGTGVRWRVAGGSDKGGILVRSDRDLNSEHLATRLATGAIVEELEKDDKALRFRKVSGNGPDAGWVSIYAGGKLLMMKLFSGIAPTQRTVRKGVVQPKVLVLHGNASGKKIMESQCAKLFSEATGKVNFFVLEAFKTCTSKEAVETMSEYFQGKPMMMYDDLVLDGRNWRCYKRVQDTLDWIQMMIRKHGPFDGVLGFAQGANFAVMLAAQATAGIGPPFSFVIAISPNAPGYVKQLPELFEVPIQIPALVIRGEQEKYDDGIKSALEMKPSLTRRKIDTLGEVHQSDHVIPLFGEDSEIFTHSEGARVVPSSMEDSGRMIATVINFALSKSNSTLPLVKVPAALPKLSSAPAPQDESLVAAALSLSDALSDLETKHSDAVEEFRSVLGQRGGAFKAYRASPPEFRADFGLTRAVVNTCGVALEYASESLRADRDIVTTAVKQDGYSLSFAAPDLQADRRVARAAIQNDGWAYEFVAPTLRTDREIAIEALKANWNAVRFVPESLRDDRHLMLLAAGRNKDAMTFVSAALQEDSSFASEAAAMRESK